MLQLSAEFLALLNDPALLIKGGRILYANAAARSLLGENCAEKSFRELFGAELAGIQAPTFIGEVRAAGRDMRMHIKTMEGMRVMILSDFAPMSEQVGEAFFSALRSELMQVGVCMAVLRARLAPKDSTACSAAKEVTRSLFRVNRTLINLSLIRGVEAGTAPFRPKTVELCTLLRDLAGSVHAIMPEPEIVLELPDTALMLGDAELLEGMMLNLLSNCIRHAAGCRRIRVLLHSTKDRYLLSVCDDGCGIPEDEMRTVMERFRCGGELNDAAHGAGLGLSAVRSVARLHGGTMMLESRESLGTSVRVSLMRGTLPKAALHNSAPDYARSYNSILTGLADCLPPDVFGEPFLDP